MDIFAGIDVGTTSVKGLAVDSEGEILSSHSSELEIQTPRPGWTQQDPEDWWRAVLKVLDGLTEGGARKLSAVCVSGQMHSLVVLDEKGEVVRPAILWSDQRTEKECSLMTRRLGGEEAVIETFGNPIYPGFTLPKLLWLAENEPDKFRAVKNWFLPKDYIVYKLTGRVGTDYSDASGTSLLNINGEFSRRALEACGIDPAASPELIDSGRIVGYAGVGVARGLEGVPVVAGGADNAVAAYGCGVENPGEAMVSLGTSGTVLAVTKNAVADPNGAIHLFRHVLKKSFYHMAVILSATNSLNWFKDRFLAELSFQALEKMVAAVPAGSNGVVFLPYLNGERTPHRDPNARGALVGFSSFHSEADIVRSIYEGVTLALREGAQLIEALGTEITNLRLVGGGSKSDTWSQLVADNFAKELWIPRVDEGAAYGSARLAAKALALNTKGWVKLKKKYSPDPERKKIYDDLFDIYKNLYKSLKDDFKSVSEFQNRLIK